jgi:hypothetical protein
MIRGRIDDGLAAVKAGLNPFVSQQMQLAFKDRWVEQARSALRDPSFASDSRGNPIFDISALAAIITQFWQPVFGTILSKREQALVHEIRSIRNGHMHQEEFDTDRALAALIAMEALLNAVGAGAEAERVRALKDATGAERFAPVTMPFAKEPAAQTELLKVESVDTALTPWRQIMAPHQDVATRRFINAEFAADLYHVAQGTAGSEYGDPIEFFARTYLTSGLRSLLETAAKRLASVGGDPVVELQTSFGGGKTHALLALHHMCSGADAQKLLGLPDVLRAAGVQEFPSIKRVVIVGTKMQAGQPMVKADGTIINTIWGELAYQLGGSEGYAIVAQADATATSPGAALDELLRRYAPCLILVDEWVAYARQLGDDALCGGTFETQFTFAQTLTESVASTPGAMLVVSLPVTEDQRGTNIELGGPRGQAALDKLRNVVARKQANWQPADASESYAIVRRRLFEPLDAGQERDRDAVVAKLFRFYKTKSDAFPPHASQRDYEERLRQCYPIHPEFFEKLYNEWGSIEGFQRTRGVLRLMAAIIHRLWDGGDTLPLILPGTMPLEDATIIGDIVRYLGEPWRNVLDRDVIGPNSVASRIDAQTPALGRAKAAQRVARAILFATAPQNAEFRPGAPTLGIDLRSIRLGTAFPGDQLGTFDDATRRLTDDATHVNSDGNRYWFAITPNLNRRVQEIAAGYERHVLLDEISKLLLNAARDRGAFARVHTVKNSSADIPDDQESRLALMPPDLTHASRRADSAARTFAHEATLRMGPADRIFRNCVVFLAPDEARLATLEESMRLSLAWQDVKNDRTFELTPSQMRVCSDKLDRAKEDVERNFRSTWIHAMVPTQKSEPGAPIAIDDIRVDAGDSIVTRLAVRLEREGLLTTSLGAINLRLELDTKKLFGDASYLPIATLFEFFCKYPWLRRLQNVNTLLRAIAIGVSDLQWRTQTFAYAEGVDASGRFLGLRAGLPMSSDLLEARTGILVTSSAAATQIDADATRDVPTSGEGGASPGSGVSSTGAGNPTPILDPEPAATAKGVRRVFLHVSPADSTLLTRVASQLANDIVAHLSALPGSNIQVAVEISGEFDSDIPNDIISRIRQNAVQHGFADLEMS